MRIALTTLSLTCLLTTISSTALADEKYTYCKMDSDFQATHRYVFNCEPGQTVVVSDIRKRYCKKDGITGENYTVNRDLYSLFCKNGYSVTATCYSGSFTQEASAQIGKRKVKIIQCPR